LHRLGRDVGSLRSNRCAQVRDVRGCRLDCGVVIGGERLPQGGNLGSNGGAVGGDILGKRGDALGQYEDGGIEVVYGSHDGNSLSVKLMQFFA
jgi:hypothetical protein